MRVNCSSCAESTNTRSCDWIKVCILASIDSANGVREQYVRLTNRSGVQKSMEIGNDFVGRMRHGELVASPQAQTVVAADICKLLDLRLYGAPHF
jgi:hypothetical protein